MRRVLDLRIVRWQSKLVYALGAWMLGSLVASILWSLGVPAPLMSILSDLLVIFGPLLLGARIFRGAGEAVAPARPWWQMTARPTLSRRLGKVLVVLTVLAVPAVVADALGIPVGDRRRPDLFGSIETALMVGLLAFLYLNSAVRLTRLGVRAPEPEFRPKFTVK